jgi:hypothetical protein
MKNNKSPHKKGVGFSFFVFLCPLLVKSGSKKTTFNNTRFLPNGFCGALKSKWHISYFYFLNYSSLAVLENRNKVCVPLCLFEKWFLISYLVINIIYRRYWWNAFKRKLCLFYSCPTAYCLTELNTCRSSVGA